GTKKESRFNLFDLKIYEDHLKQQHLEADVVEAANELRQIIVNGGVSLDAARAGTIFVILGATSELCPLKNLLDAGFTCIGISRPKASGQKELQDYAKASSGTLILPQLVGSEIPG